MIYSAKPLLKNALDPDGAGHTLALPPDDPFIVSCPGSGKTWPRFGEPRGLTATAVSLLGDNTSGGEVGKVGANVDRDRP